MKGIFVSDLHLFSRRSVAIERWKELELELRNASWLVLGGDIFDFRWSSFADQAATLDAAGSWIENVIQMQPHLQISYVAGNHDSHPSMRRLLQELSSSHTQFQWHDHTFQLGDKLFLHGDIIDASSHVDGLERYRNKFAVESKSRGTVANLLYDSIVAMRVHRLPRHFVHRPNQILSRLYHCLVREGLTTDQKVRKIYFGHTHAPMHGASYRGYLFYNPGSAIRHLPFRPCLFDCEQESQSIRDRNDLE
jgi:UDP-2,3-diacylglucosamine hydrolase